MHCRCICAEYQFWKYSWNYTSFSTPFFSQPTIFYWGEMQKIKSPVLTCCSFLGGWQSKGCTRCKQGTKVLDNQITCFWSQILVLNNLEKREMCTNNSHPWKTVLLLTSGTLIPLNSISYALFSAHKILAYCTRVWFHNKIMVLKCFYIQKSFIAHVRFYNIADL